MLDIQQHRFRMLAELILLLHFMLAQLHCHVAVQFRCLAFHADAEHAEILPSGPPCLSVISGWLTALMNRACMPIPQSCDENEWGHPHEMNEHLAYRDRTTSS